MYINELLSILGKSINTIVMNILYFSFFKTAYEYKDRKQWVPIAIFLALTSSMLFVRMFDSIMVNSIFSIISLNICCAILCKASIKKFFLHNTMLMMLFVFSDIITVLIWTLIKGDSIDTVLSTDLLIIISCALNIIFMYILYRIYITIISKLEVKAIKIIEISSLLTATLFELFMAYNLAAKIKTHQDGLCFIMTIFGFCLFNLFLTYVIDKVGSAYEYKYQLSLSKMQNEIQLSHYREMNNKQQDYRKTIHDMKKHLATLNSLNKINSERAQEYKKNMTQNLEDLSFGCSCSNEILSIVMSDKLIYANNHNIKVDINIQEIYMDFITDTDITAIFGNLWDNAIEACEKLEEKNRSISISVKESNGYILINFENNFNNVIKKHKNKFCSTKEDHDGVGIPIIESTIEKYRGVYYSSVRENVFETQLTIPVQNKVVSV